MWFLIACLDLGVELVQQKKKKGKKGNGQMVYICMEKEHGSR